ncbi:MAG: LCP family protein [Clostridia bacterium]|nr:LCP family protein [Clostridia bacterium]
MQGKKILAFVMLSLAVFSFLGASLATDLPVADRSAEAEAVAKGGACNLLILGRDNAAGLCDVLMLASFDPSAGRLCLLQIPRDTYFAYTKGSYKKINAAPRVLGGADKLADKLSEALGVRIDGYVELDLAFVGRAVDMLGGVELNVPCDMDYDDPAQGLSIHLKKGLQTLSGDEAASFVRFRSGYVRADLGRMDAQKLFLAAFAKAFSAKIGARDLPETLLLAMRYVKTNIRVDTAIALVSGARRLPSESITVLTLPGEEVQSSVSGAWYYILSREGCAEAIAQYVGGEITDFDREGLCADKSRAGFYDIYQKKISAVPYTFDGLMRDGVAIE